MKNQINTQTDFGPLEDLKTLLSASPDISDALITIGSTRYTSYGETMFLQENDEIIVVVYDGRQYLSKVSRKEYEGKDISMLVQKVVL